MIRKRKEDGRQDGRRRKADFKKLMLRLDMVEYLIFPKKADEAPIPMNKVIVPFYSTLIEIMK